jgi:Flp pilus assembly protein TadG
MKPMTSMWLRLRRSALDLYRDRRGVMAIEFAVIAPVMLVMFFGTVELSSGIAVNRKVTLMARTLSDLTSQNISVTSTQLNNIFNASTGIMTPYSATPLQLQSTITELWIDPSTSNARVQWSQGSAARAQGSSVVIPPNLIGKDSSGKVFPNQYLIYSEVSYLYTPAVGYVMAKAGITLSDFTYTRPRQSNCVDHLPLAGSTLPCTPVP